MSIYRAQTMALYLLVLSALGTVFSAETFEWPLIAGIFTATCASLIVPYRLRERWSESRVVVLGLILLLGGVLLEVWNGLRDIISGATLFLVLVLVSRLFTKRTSNDAVQILTLSFVVVLAGSALNATFAFAPYFALVIICSIWALTTTHLTRAAESAPELARELRISRRFWVTTSVLAVVVFAQTTLFFVLFPRMGLGYFKPKIRSSSTSTGFSDRVELGQAGHLENDSTVVARLEFAEMPSNFDPERLYFRGATLSRFDGTHWMKTGRGQTAVHFRADGTFLLHKADPKADVRFRYYQEPTESEYLFLPELTHTARLLQDNPLVAGHMRVRIYTDDSGDVTIIRPLGMAMTLEAWFEPNATAMRDEDDPDALVVPAIDARIAELAKTWRGTATKADAIATNLNMGLSGAEYSYSAEMIAPPEGQNPIAFFLLDRKAGHCEYYASALALMLRMSGVPARIVSGYRGASFNPYGKYFAVEEFRAHSWVEYRSPGRGWVRIDPTPAGRADEFGLLERFSAMSDLLRYRWNRYVVEYDLDLQISALRSIKHSFDKPPGTPPSEQSTLTELAKAFKWHALGLVSVIAAAIVLRRRRRAPIPRDVEASRLFRSFERVLEKRGHGPRPLQQPPNLYFSQVAERDPAAATAAQRFATAYLHARFSGEVTEDDVVIMRAMLQDVRHFVPKTASG